MESRPSGGAPADADEPPDDDAASPPPEDDKKFDMALEYSGSEMTPS